MHGWVLFGVLLLLPLVKSCSRYRYFGDRCVGYEEDMCDPRRMLKCNRGTGTCQCPDYYYYFFDKYYGRCYHKIGTACKEHFGGIAESRWNHGCPENSFCNPGSGYCRCNPLYHQNYDGTGCYIGGSTIRRATLILLPIFLLGKFLG